MNTSAVHGPAPQLSQLAARGTFTASVGEWWADSAEALERIFVCFNAVIASSEDNSLPFPPASHLSDLPPAEPAPAPVLPLEDLAGLARDNTSVPLPDAPGLESWLDDELAQGPSRRLNAANVPQSDVCVADLVLPGRLHDWSRAGYKGEQASAGQLAARCGVQIMVKHLIC